MGGHSGPADWWTEGTDKGREHVATKGIVTDGLVLNLDAGVNASYPGTGSTWFDLSGNNLNFTMVGAPTWNSIGYFNNFSSVNYFECNTSTGWTSILPTGDNPRTICALVQRTTGVTYEHVIHYGNAVSQQAYGLAVFTSNNLIGDHRWSTSNFGAAVASGNNYFLSTRYDTTTYPGARFQINSTFTTETDITGNLSTGTTTLRVGSRISTLTEIWNGNISTVMVYNRALSDDELLQNFNAIRGRYSI